VLAGSAETGEAWGRSRQRGRPGAARGGRTQRAAGALPGTHLPVAFLGAIILGKSLDEAIEVGHRLGAMCVGQVRLLI